MSCVYSNDFMRAMLWSQFVQVIKFLFSVTKEVVAMGTGTKCIGQNKMRKTGKYGVKTSCATFFLAGVIESVQMSKAQT